MINEIAFVGDHVVSERHPTGCYIHRFDGAVVECSLEKFDDKNILLRIHYTLIAIDANELVSLAHFIMEHGAARKEEDTRILAERTSKQAVAARLEAEAEEEVKIALENQLQDQAVAPGEVIAEEENKGAASED